MTSVEVRRTGGFAGMTRQGAVDLDSDDPRVPEVRSLVDRIDFEAVPEGRPPPTGSSTTSRAAPTAARSTRPT